MFSFNAFLDWLYYQILLVLLICCWNTLRVSESWELHCPDGRSLANYSGNVSVTDGGRQCKTWNVEDNQTSEPNNHCRNIKNPLPWCWVSDPYLQYQSCAERICGGSPCGGTLSIPSLLSFNDTNGEWFYYHGKDCLWTLVAPEDSIVQFDLMQLDIDCDTTHLVVYEYNPEQDHYISVFHWMCPASYNYTSNLQSGKRIWSTSNVLYVHYECTVDYLKLEKRTGGALLALISHVKQEVCDVNEFMCTDETCILDEYRCDGTFADCPGGEDELNCDAWTRNPARPTEETTLTVAETKGPTRATEKSTLRSCQRITGVSWVLQMFLPAVVFCIEQ